MRLLLGDLSQGALGGVMAAAVAKAAEVPAADVRRALTLSGDLAAVAAIALAEGQRRAGRRAPRGRPPAVPDAGRHGPERGAALERTGPAAVEWKLDGARVQIHRDGDAVAVYTRTLDEVADRVPEVVAAALALPARSLVLDGEVIALRPDGRPHPFQVTGSRFGARRDLERLQREIPLSVFAFDVLHARRRGPARRAAGRSARRRSTALAPPELRVPRDRRRGPGDGAGGVRRRARRRPRGRDGQGARRPVRGRAAAAPAWLKVKPVHTLDLVVLAVEWGHGRRRGFLSNLHLGARDGDGLGDAGQDVQGPHRRAARVADRALPGARDRIATATSSTSAPSRSSRSPSTASSARAATRRAWRCASRA